MTKRDRDGSAQDAGGGSKHARVRESQRDREPESVPRRRKLKGVRLPVDIAALAHVLQQLEDLLLTPDEAMLEAAALGRVTWVQELLGRFDCELLEPLHVAAANGHAGVLEALLDKLVKPPSEPGSDTWYALQHALMAAGEREHLAVLQLLVTCFLAATSTLKREHAASTVTLVLEDAAAHGQLAVVDLIATHAAPLLVEFVDLSEESPALTAAIMGRHVDVAWYLLDRGVDGVIFDFVTAFCVALDAGLNDLADRIYDVYPLRRHERNALLLELAVDDSVDAVRYILDKGVDLDLVNKAFKKAAKAGAVAVVQFLWTSFEISPEYLDEVFKKTAISAGKAIQVLPILYEMKRPSPRIIYKVFRDAHDVAVLKLLLEMEQVPDDAIVAAFEHAVAVDFRDKFAILELLHKRECISPQVLTDALVVAATQGNSAFVDLVRGDSRILCEALDKAFVDSVFSENGNRMKGLYDSRLVSPAAICVTFVIAAARNQLQTATILANYLSVESNVPRHFKDVAFVFLATRGQLQLIEALNQNGNGEWSLSVLQQALEAASDDSIRNYIRIITCNLLFHRHVPGLSEAVMKFLTDWRDGSKDK